MHPAPFTPDRQETEYHLDVAPSLAGPVVWVLRWVVRAFIWGQFILGRFEPPVLPAAGPKLNRQMRRAQRACLRRFDRHEARGRVGALSDYTPRFYDFLAWRSLAPEGISRARYQDFYARASGQGRVRVFGLSRPHQITVVITALMTRIGLTGRALNALPSRPMIDDIGPAPP